MTWLPREFQTFSGDSITTPRNGKVLEALVNKLDLVLEVEPIPVQLEVTNCRTLQDRL